MSCEMSSSFFTTESQLPLSPRLLVGTTEWQAQPGLVASLLKACQEPELGGTGGPHDVAALGGTPAHLPAGSSPALC